jgi:hypothetical protein
VILTALNKGFIGQDVIHKKPPGAVCCGNLAALRKSLRGGAQLDILLNSGVWAATTNEHE